VASGPGGPVPALPPVAPPTAGPAAPSNPISAAITSALQKQDGLAPLLANLAQLLERPRAPLPPDLRAAIERVLGFRVAPGEDLTAASLKRLVEGSGVFLEKRLAGGAPPEMLQGDLKAALLRLKEALTPLAKEAAALERAGEQIAKEHPPRRGGAPDPQRPGSPTLPAGGLADVAQALADQTEAALARVRLAQIAAIAPDSSGFEPSKGAATQSVQLDVPLALAGQARVLSLTVERDPERSGAAHAAGGPTWSVWFALDLGAQGPVTGRVTLAGGSGAIGVTLWSDRPETRAALGDALAEMRAELDREALPVGELAARAGHPRRSGAAHVVDTST
jgi:hypothetical protein